MWSRGKILTATGLFLLPLLFATALGQGDDKPIVQNTPPGRFQKIPNLPDCITAAVEQGDPRKGGSEGRASREPTYRRVRLCSCQTCAPVHMRRRFVFVLSALGRAVRYS